MMENDGLLADALETTLPQLLVFDSVRDLTADEKADSRSGAIAVG
jgi:hypothetical protein